MSNWDIYPARERVEKALNEGETVTIASNAEHMIILEAGNRMVAIYPGLPMWIRFLNPKPGLPRFSDWLRKLADEAAKHEWKYER